MATAAPVMVKRMFMAVSPLQWCGAMLPHVSSRSLRIHREWGANRRVAASTRLSGLAEWAWPYNCRMDSALKERFSGVDRLYGAGTVDPRR